MKQFSLEQVKMLKYLIKWFVYILPVSAVVGSLIALFLWLLDSATRIRWANEWLIYLLPFIGVCIVWMYRRLGKNSDAGNNLVMDEIHKPGGGVPLRMTPFVLVSTVITHLFGGSAGREGTAVQIGGSISSFIGKWMGLDEADLRILLMTGVAAGFGAVFGTPIAGTIFALEVLAIGRIKYDALLPCLMAAVLADIVCSLYGIQHTHYSIQFHDISPSGIAHFHLNPMLLLYVALAGILFGLVGFMFAESMHLLKSVYSRWVKWPLMVPVIGGISIILLTSLLGTRDYLGLGVSANTPSASTIVNAFKVGGVDQFSWFWKLVFTVITLSSGFKGGEVTPLFFIGATLGNFLAMSMNLPVDLFAGLGFIAVFAGATNTPLACTVMGVELFGGEHIGYFAVACFVAYYFSGHSGIYSSQRIGVSKANLVTDLKDVVSLKHFRDLKMK